jgi:FkbH-like protein
MAEAVRLVIWDLDETFWKGTLTEGGYTYNQANHDLVIELARRGIMSSICSKNDLEPVKKILEERGIWDYFIFPSINWEPKGVRIQALIENIQLRPETVMFIDDNPMNLNEALHFTPALQTVPHTFVPEILTSPLFKGKDDSKLSRLNQYKLMEKRKAEEAVAMEATGGSNVEFLRGSNIRVRIERDIEKHIDRAVELVNRTNQLNFTKLRLPEDPAEARRALLEQMGHHLAQAGLIEVYDNYGNYGYCGFYLTRMRGEETRLMHFCFSCRILNMGVEAWLYQSLGRPALDVRGHVLSDPLTAPPVDWITAAGADKQSVAAEAASAPQFGSVAARGGCVLMPLMHYFNINSPQVVGEFNIMRDGVVIRLDHSLCFRHAIEGIPAAAIDAFTLLGYEPKDFETRFFEYSGQNPIWIFSNWADLGCRLYRHKKTGVSIPFKLPPPNNRATEKVQHAAFYLKEYFEPVGLMGEQEIKDNMRAVFSRVPPHGRLFALLALEGVSSTDGGQRVLGPREKLNRWTCEVAAEFPTVTVLRMDDFIENEKDIKAFSGAGHFDRMVYFRVYQHIAQVAGRQIMPQPSAA